MAHTLTPWRIVGRDGEAWTITDEQSRHAAFPVIFGEYGNRICNVDSHEDEDCDANAEFIVRAVNSHEEVVEALKSLVHYFEPLEVGVALFNNLPCLRERVDKAQAILAKAEGKEAKP